jgi:hypothetical protein
MGARMVTLISDRHLMGGMIRTCCFVERNRGALAFVFSIMGPTGVTVLRRTVRGMIRAAMRPAHKHLMNSRLMLRVVSSALSGCPHHDNEP